MDIETSEAIESLRADIGRVETTLTAEIGKLREQMVSRAEFRGEMASMRDEARRHALMLNESVRDDIRIVAEGVAALSAKVDRLLPPT